MTLHTRQSGAWAKVNGLFIRQSGVWTPVKNAYVRDGGVWKAYYSSEIVVSVTASRAALVLNTLFTAPDWASDTPKRVIIESGVTISGASWGAVAAQNSGTAATWGGNLVLENRGIISGVGGAGNSGVGGQALHDNGGVAFGKPVQVINTGTIRSGGGGGGQGGQGGTGSYGVTVRDPASGDVYQGPSGSSNYLWSSNASTNFNFASVLWASGQAIVQPSPKTVTSVDFGGYTYYRGNFRTGDYYGIFRTYTAIQYQAGAAGGAGGRGQGTDGANAVGAGGGNNGGNSGVGGTGGTGGTWGSNGNPGANGNTGNYAGGGAGAGGGLAGIAYTASLWSMTNTGTIQGRVT